MIRRLLCWFGWHDWKDPVPYWTVSAADTDFVVRLRECRRCGRLEKVGRSLNRD